MNNQKGIYLHFPTSYEITQTAKKLSWWCKKQEALLLKSVGDVFEVKKELLKAIEDPNDIIIRTHSRFKRV